MWREDRAVTKIKSDRSLVVSATLPLGSRWRSLSELIFECKAELGATLESRGGNKCACLSRRGLTRLCWQITKDPKGLTSQLKVSKGLLGELIPRTSYLTDEDLRLGSLRLLSTTAVPFYLGLGHNEILSLPSLSFLYKLADSFSSYTCPHMLKSPLKHHSTDRYKNNVP